MTAAEELIGSSSSHLQVWLHTHQISCLIHSILMHYCAVLLARLMLHCASVRKRHDLPRDVCTLHMGTSHCDQRESHPCRPRELEIAKSTVPIFPLPTSCTFMQPLEASAAARQQQPDQVLPPAQHLCLLKRFHSSAQSRKHHDQSHASPTTSSTAHLALPTQMRANGAYAPRPNSWSAAPDGPVTSPVVKYGRN